MMRVTVQLRRLTRCAEQYKNAKMLINKLRSIDNERCIVHVVELRSMLMSYDYELQTTINYRRITRNVFMRMCRNDNEVLAIIMAPHKRMAFYALVPDTHAHQFETKLLKYS